MALQDTKVDSIFTIRKTSQLDSNEGLINICIANVSEEEYKLFFEKLDPRQGYQTIYIPDLNILSQEETINLTKECQGLYIDSPQLDDMHAQIITDSNCRICEFSEKQKLDKEFPDANANKAVEILIYELLSDRKKELSSKWVEKVETLLTSNLFDNQSQIDLLKQELYDLFAVKDSTTLAHISGVYDFLTVMNTGLDILNMSLNEEDKLLLSQATLLHDIAKLVIPDHLIKNNDQLTPGELGVMQSHANINASYFFSSELSQKVKNILSIAMQHHTTYDNQNGYTDTKFDNQSNALNIPKGQNINPIARMITVIDSFEAMTAGRSYQNKLTVEQGIKILYNNSRPFDPNQRGTGQFDPVFAYAFCIGLQEGLKKNDPTIIQNMINRDRKVSPDRDEKNIIDKVNEELELYIKSFEEIMKGESEGKRK